MSLAIFICFILLKLCLAKPQIKMPKDVVLRHLFVGMTGFEPATPRPPGVCANRAAPHPETECKNKEIIGYNK